MPENSASPCSITLEGEWFMDKAADLLELLADKLAHLLEANPGLAKVEIDMAGVVDLDACGCQLLVVFLENVRRHGITPLPCCMQPQVMDKIERLGFAEAFAAS